MSISQKSAVARYSDTLPNFRNLGILLRLLLFVNAATLAVALATSNTIPKAAAEVLDLCSRVQPPLFAVAVVLAALQPALARLPFLFAALGVTLLVALITVAWQGFANSLFGMGGDVWRALLFAVSVTLAALAYFSLRARALSPALAEARLQALQARIRPHFLFNSLNAVLSLIREDARRAEQALEDLADLFRVLMADNRELTPLVREVDLCRQYLDIEMLRLGPRLQVDWQIDEMPDDALVPPLVLQPLLENAVYHGIEPRTEPGTVTIRIWREGTRVRAMLRNPFTEHDDRHAGNRMALDNIRERLLLHFDAEARLATSVRDHLYEVDITMPYETTPRAVRGQA